MCIIFNIQQQERSLQINKLLSLYECKYPLLQLVFGQFNSTRREILINVFFLPKLSFIKLLKIRTFHITICSYCMSVNASWTDVRTELMGRFIHCFPYYPVRRGRSALSDFPVNVWTLDEYGMMTRTGELSVPGNCQSLLVCRLEANFLQ